MNRTIMDRVRSMLHPLGLPKQFGVYIFEIRYLHTLFLRLQPPTIVGWENRQISLTYESSAANASSLFLKTT